MAATKRVWLCTALDADSPAALSLFLFSYSCLLAACKARSSPQKQSPKAKRLAFIFFPSPNLTYPVVPSWLSRTLVCTFPFPLLPLSPLSSLTRPISPCLLWSLSAPSRFPPKQWQTTPKHAKLTAPEKERRRQQRYCQSEPTLFNALALLLLSFASLPAAPSFSFPFLSHQIYLFPISPCCISNRLHTFTIFTPFSSHPISVTSFFIFCHPYSLFLPFTTTILPPTPKSVSMRRKKALWPPTLR